jgi:diketogulonate reductase-like aldo/keto reductase
LQRASRSGGGAASRERTPAGLYLRTFVEVKEMRRLGIGTWRLGEASSRSAQDVAAIRAALDQGLTLIDTAEMYGNGGSEEVVGRSISGRRDSCFLVSKVLPQNASRKGTKEACERSLKRMGTDTIDLYLLHWRGSHPLEETVAAFRDLVAQGKIRRWGVSNFDLDDMQELVALEHGEECAANQVYYSLSERGIEFQLKPWMDERGIVTMAYCPLDEGRLPRHPGLQSLAGTLGATAAQLALAWLLSRANTWAIPMTSSPERAAQNRAALDLALSPPTLAALDELFPPPRKRSRLKIV